MLVCAKVCDRQLQKTRWEKKKKKKSIEVLIAHMTLQNSSV